ncbi:MAG: hypothetical protein Q4G66_11105 [bacterium]|nr:hypothetical protein [bacterium]
MKTVIPNALKHIVGISKDVNGKDALAIEIIGWQLSPYGQAPVPIMIDGAPGLEMELLNLQTKRVLYGGMRFELDLWLKVSRVVASKELTQLLDMQIVEAPPDTPAQ